MEILTGRYEVQLLILHKFTLNKKIALLMTHNNKVKSQNADFGHNYLKGALFQNDVKGTSDQLHWPRL